MRRTDDAPHKGARDASGAEEVKQTFFWKYEKFKYKFEIMIITKQNRPETRSRRFTLPSKAVPDQTMSLKTLVNKYVRGLPISAPDLKGIYTGDDLAKEFNKLDYAEQEEMNLRLSEELTTLKDTFAANEERKRKETQENALKQTSRLEELEKKLAELTKPA